MWFNGFLNKLLETSKKKPHEDASTRTPASISARARSMKGTSLVSAECRNLGPSGRLKLCSKFEKNCWTIVCQRIKASGDSSSWRTFPWQIQRVQSPQDASRKRRKPAATHSQTRRTQCLRQGAWRPGNFALKTSAIACAEKFQCLRLPSWKFSTASLWKSKYDMSYDMSYGTVCTV